MQNKPLVDRFLCALLMLLLLIYHVQTVILPNSEAIGLYLLVVILGISLYYVIRSLLIKKKFTGFMKVWLLFTLMYLLYFMFYDDYSQYGIIKMVLLNFLPFFPFYYFAEKEILTRNHLILFFLVILPIFIVKFYQSINNLRIEEMRDNVIENTIYLFIGLLPFTFLFRRKILTFLFLLLIWFIIVQSAKRAAIICGAIAMGLFIIQYVYASNVKSKFKRYLVAAILSFGIGYFGYSFYIQNQFLMERISMMLEGYSSGRDMLIETLFSVWYQSDHILRYLFGFGYNASDLNSIHVSHNDWMDMLISFGIFGLTIYFILFWLLIKQLFKSGWSSEKKIIFILVIAIAIVTSMTSRWYWSTFTYMQTLILPYLLVTFNKKH